MIVSLGLAIPAGYALARLKLPFRGLILLTLLIPQAFPNLPVYVNIAQMFYSFGLNGTITGVVLVHVTHGLVYAVWIATAAFSAIDREIEEAARSMGASALKTFFDITLPIAAPGLLASAIFVFLNRSTSSPALTSSALRTFPPCPCCFIQQVPAAIIKSHRSAL